jgi:hypothetical protein
MKNAKPVPPALLAKLRAICLALPEVTEEAAWVGTRYCVRKKNFAHILSIAEGWPPAYAKAADDDGPITVMTFRSPAQEQFDVFRSAGRPFFVPGWWNNIVGLVVDERTDWQHVGALVRDSYRALAPQKLVAQLQASAPKNAPKTSSR